MPRDITVDRIEGTRALIVVGDETVEIPASVLPAGAAEGAVLLLTLGDDSAARSAAEARLARLTAATTVPDEIDL